MTFSWLKSFKKLYKTKDKVLLLVPYSFFLFSNAFSKGKHYYHGKATIKHTKHLSRGKGLLGVGGQNLTGWRERARAQERERSRTHVCGTQVLLYPCRG